MQACLCPRCASARTAALEHAGLGVASGEALLYSRAWVCARGLGCFRVRVGVLFGGNRGGSGLVLGVGVVGPLVPLPVVMLVVVFLRRMRLAAQWWAGSVVLNCMCVAPGVTSPACPVSGS